MGNGCGPQNAKLYDQRVITKRIPKGKDGDKSFTIRRKVERGKGKQASKKV